MGIFSIFSGGPKYFDKKITPKCDYCRFGKRSNAGNKIICEKKGLVDPNYSCGNFIYSPLKRIPVKQLNFVGSLADEDLYIESKGDKAEKEAAERAEKEAAAPKKPAAEPKPVQQPAAPAPQKEAAPADAPAPQAAPAQPEAPKEENPKQEAAPVQQEASPAAAPAPQQTAPVQQNAPAPQQAPESAPQSPNA